MQQLQKKCQVKFLINIKKKSPSNTLILIRGVNGRGAIAPFVPPPPSTQVGDMGTVLEVTLTLIKRRGTHYAHSIMRSPPSYESHRRACIDLIDKLCFDMGFIKDFRFEIVELSLLFS